MTFYGWVFMALQIAATLFLFAIWAELRHLNRSPWYRALRVLLDKEARRRRRL